MNDTRRRIILDYAKWTALSALRSGAPIKSRAGVYPLLDAVKFEAVLVPGPRITVTRFDAWHETETRDLCARHGRLPVGWGAKLINVYLKTAAFVGDLGRPGLIDALHPPIDGGLWTGLARAFRSRRDILCEACAVRRIKDITDYPTYRRIITGYRLAAADRQCKLIEVEQFWVGAATPVV